jgi:hypothetical protein
LKPDGFNLGRLRGLQTWSDDSKANEFGTTIAPRLSVTSAVGDKRPAVLARGPKQPNIARIVEEPRLVEICLSHDRRSKLDLESVLTVAMTIADEIDSPLQQAALGFVPSVAEISACRIA